MKIQRILRYLCLFTFIAGCANKENKPATNAQTLFITESDTFSGDGLVLTAHWGGVNWRWLCESPPDAPDHIKVLDSARLIHVAVTISNPTADTLSFSSMSCSYENSFFVDDTATFAIHQQNICFKNGPIDIKVPPKMKTDRYIMLRQRTSFRDIPTKPVKIGMRVGYKILWSNELYPDRLWRANYTNDKASIAP